MVSAARAVYPGRGQVRLGDWHCWRSACRLHGGGRRLGPLAPSPSAVERFVNVCPAAASGTALVEEAAGLGPPPAVPLAFAGGLGLWPFLPLSSSLIFGGGRVPPASILSAVGRLAGQSWTGGKSLVSSAAAGWSGNGEGGGWPWSSLRPASSLVIAGGLGRRPSLPLSGSLIFFLWRRPLPSISSVAGRIAECCLLLRPLPFSAVGHMVHCSWSTRPSASTSLRPGGLAGWF